MTMCEPLMTMCEPWSFSYLHICLRLYLHSLYYHKFFNVLVKYVCQWVTAISDANSYVFSPNCVLPHTPASAKGWVGLVQIQQLGPESERLLLLVWLYCPLPLLHMKKYGSLVRHCALVYSKSKLRNLAEDGNFWHAEQKKNEHVLTLH